MSQWMSIQSLERPPVVYLRTKRANINLVLLNTIHFLEHLNVLPEFAMEDLVHDCFYKLYAFFSQNRSKIPVKL